MLYYGLILFVQIVCLIHAGRTGRPYYWFMVILFVPGLGILAYLVIEVIPGLLRGRAAALLSQTVSAGLDPTRQYREFARAVETVPSVANFRALADECLRLERHDEAIDHYKRALTGMLRRNPARCSGSSLPNSERVMPARPRRPSTASSRRTRISAPPKPICSQRVFSKPGVACPRRSAPTAALRDLSRRGGKGQDGAAA
jgi:hypothetical protein